jgi:hypothetical protein
MAYLIPSRTTSPAAWMAALVFCCVISPACAQPGGGQRGGFGQHAMAGAPRAQRQQEHLPQWMDRHRNQPLAEQQRELEKEPGFHDLPPQTQQRLRDQITQLNSMPPEQRRRLLGRTEIMESLSPAQRQQFRSSVQQLGTFPPERRRLVARAFRDIREMPVPQRQAVLNSDRFRSQFSDQERGTLSNLLAVEPYVPAQRPNEAPPQFGK